MPTSLEFLTIEPKQPAKISVIWLHGLGADGHDFYSLVPELHLPQETAIRFIFPHAPVRKITMNSNMPMRGWYDIYSLESFALEDQAGIEQSQQLIIEFIEQEKQRGMRSNQIVLAGFSQGGAMSLYTGLRYPEPLAGILALSCYLPLPHHFSPKQHSANAKVPILMAHGIYDPLLPIQLAEQTYQYLKNLKYPIGWHQYPMEHQVCTDEIRDITRWLTEKLT